MNRENPLNAGVFYIEPVQHPEFLCHMVYKNGRTLPSAKPSESLIDALLIHTYGTTINALRNYLKMTHQIQRQGPIILDEQLQFVVYTSTVRRQKIQFWVNVYHFLRFTPGPSPGTTIIRFSDRTRVEVHADFAFC